MEAREARTAQWSFFCLSFCFGLVAGVVIPLLYDGGKLTLEVGFNYRVMYA